MGARCRPSNAPTARVPIGISPAKRKAELGPRRLRPRRPRLDSGGGLARMKTKPRTAQAMLIVCTTIRFQPEPGLATTNPAPSKPPQATLGYVRLSDIFLIFAILTIEKFGTPGRTRTCDRSLRVDRSSSLSYGGQTKADYSAIARGSVHSTLPLKF